VYGFCPISSVWFFFIFIGASFDWLLPCHH
jgi:hypothetical protein